MTTDQPNHPLNPEPTNLPQILADLEYVKGRGCPITVLPSTREAITNKHTVVFRSVVADLQWVIMEIMGWWATETKTERYSVQPAGDGTWVVRLYGSYMPVSSRHRTPFAAHAAVLREIVEALKGDDHD
jgi:hypothetical protein